MWATHSDITRFRDDIPYADGYETSDSVPAADERSFIGGCLWYARVATVTRLSVLDVTHSADTCVHLLKVRSELGTSRHFRYESRHDMLRIASHRIQVGERLSQYIISNDQCPVRKQWLRGANTAGHAHSPLTETTDALMSSTRRCKC